MSDMQEFLTKSYQCPFCKTAHEVTFPKDLAENRTKFPFPFVYLHSRDNSSELQDLLTILYIDDGLHVRGAEIIEVEDSITNIFSKELTKQITEKLTDKIVELEAENVRLKEYVKFQKGAGSPQNERELQAAQDEEMEIKIQKMSKETENVIGTLLDGLAEVETIHESSELIVEEAENEDSKAPTKETRKQMVIQPRIRVKTPTGPRQRTSTRITIFVLSTIGPYGEKRQKMTINSDVSIDTLKEKIGKTFGLDPSAFHLASNGITLTQFKQLWESDIKNGDEILILPTSTAGLKKLVPELK